MLPQLKIADPQTHAWVAQRIDQMNPRPSKAFLKQLEEQTIWALSQEQTFGQSVAQGLLVLASTNTDSRVDTYCRLVHQAARTGVTLGRIMAVHLVPVLHRAPTLLDRFMATVAVMQSKGTYTLNAPLEMLAELLNGDDPASAHTYLNLLSATFGLSLTYNQSLGLVYLLPKAVKSFDPRRRIFQITQLQRTVETDPRLADSYMEGMDKGLALLSAEALDEFIGTALRIHATAPETAGAFLRLGSRLGRETCTALQVAVPLQHVKDRLNRYVAARLGRPIPIEPMSSASVAQRTAPWVTSDGNAIYLRDEIDHFESTDRNRGLYGILVRLEACFFEYDSFGFDAERLADLLPDLAARRSNQPRETETVDGGDAVQWFGKFSIPALAEDLVNLFEQARIMRCIGAHYPGLVRQAVPILRREARRIWGHDAYDHPLMDAYSTLVLNRCDGSDSTRQAEISRHLIRIFRASDGRPDRVEAAAYLTAEAFDAVARSLSGITPADYPLLATPFGWRLQWQAVARKRQQHTRRCSTIKARLADHDLRVYQADLEQWMARHEGQVALDEFKTFLMTQAKDTPLCGAAIDWDRVDLEAILGAAGCRPDASEIMDAAGCRYPEWDCRAQDYLHAHTRVQQKPLHGNGDLAFYRETLTRHQGLLSHTRRAFELLKPEGLKLLRQWPEGDAFDYRALLDFAVDRRAGRIPSDRLFIKRIKKERSVAVLLLVDMSRSTANTVSVGALTVLDIAKEALVIFCEALEMVGDTYAIAGFSGTGRHAVDYFEIKAFEEGLTFSVKSRISAMSPQRSTRMGAAIRHAAVELSRIPAAVRLMIVVSDGFPNDLGYKADYAIADTRRAIQEARSSGQHVKAITVNIGSDPRLDDLYGRYDYHVIENVVELPDKLIKMYGTLTRA